MTNKNLNYIMIGFTLMAIIMLFIQNEKINNLIQGQKNLNLLRNLTKKLGGYSLEQENRTPIGYQIEKTLS